MVLFWRDLWVPQQTRGMYSVCLGEACLCQLLTDNLLPVYNFVQKCIILAKNVMSVLAPI